MSFAVAPPVNANQSADLDALVPVEALELAAQRSRSEAVCECRRTVAHSRPFVLGLAAIVVAVVTTALFAAANSRRTPRELTARPTVATALRTPSAPPLRRARRPRPAVARTPHRRRRIEPRARAVAAV